MDAVEPAAVVQPFQAAEVPADAQLIAGAAAAMPAVAVLPSHSVAARSRFAAASASTATQASTAPVAAAAQVLRPELGPSEEEDKVMLAADFGDLGEGVASDVESIATGKKRKKKKKGKSVCDLVCDLNEPTPEIASSPSTVYTHVYTPSGNYVPQVYVPKGPYTHMVNPTITPLPADWDPWEGKRKSKPKSTIPKGDEACDVEHIEQIERFDPTDPWGLMKKRSPKESVAFLGAMWAKLAAGTLRHPREQGDGYNNVEEFDFWESASEEDFMDSTCVVVGNGFSKKGSNVKVKMRGAKGKWG